MAEFITARSSSSLSLPWESGMAQQTMNPPGLSPLERGSTETSSGKGSSCGHPVIDEAEV